MWATVSSWSCFCWLYSFSIFGCKEYNQSDFNIDFPGGSDGKQNLGGQKQKLLHIWTQEKGAVTPQETDPDLPVTVQESRVEAWVSGGLLQGWGHCAQQCLHGTFWRKSPLSSLPPPQFGLRTNNREGTQPHPSTEIGLRIFVLHLCNWLNVWFP